MRLQALVAALALAFTSVCALADPVGHYTVSGKNPGNGSKYSGTVDIEQTGDTYKVIWDIGGTKYFGTGIGDSKFIAVSYKSGNSTGLAMYAPNGDNWTGIWAYAGGKKLGQENWTRE